MPIGSSDLRVIIAGGGDIGLRTAELLDERGHDVVIIERDPARCDEISDRYVATLIEGDATRPNIFAQANPESADVVAALTDSTPSNLAICMMGERKVDGLHTVMRTDAETGDVHADLVGDVIFPERASALLAVNAIMGGDVRSLEHAMGTLEIMEIRVREEAPAAGKTLEAISFPTGSLIVSDVDGSRIARPDTVLHPDRRYIVAVEPDVADEVMRLLRG
jgi:trk system potassium uptake protein TrkA